MVGRINFSLSAAATDDEGMTEGKRGVGVLVGGTVRVGQYGIRVGFPRNKVYLQVFITVVSYDNR